MTECVGQFGREPLLGPVLRSLHQMRTHRVERNGACREHRVLLVQHDGGEPPLEQVPGPNADGRSRRRCTAGASRRWRWQGRRPSPAPGSGARGSASSNRPSRRPRPCGSAPPGGRGTADSPCPQRKRARGDCPLCHMMREVRSGGQDARCRSECRNGQRQPMQSGNM